jgi:hypothetical protein
VAHAPDQSRNFAGSHLAPRAADANVFAVEIDLSVWQEPGLPANRDRNSDLALGGNAHLDESCIILKGKKSARRVNDAAEDESSGPAAPVRSQSRRTQAAPDA